MAGALSSCGDAGMVQGAGGSAHVIRYRYNYHNHSVDIFKSHNFFTTAFAQSPRRRKSYLESYSFMHFDSCMGIRVHGKVLRQ